MSPPPLDSDLYERVKRDASRVFSRKTSAYKSMWISREYKKRGGRYGKEGRERGRERRGKEGTTRWLKERWVQVGPYLEEGEEVACGDQHQTRKGRVRQTGRKGRKEEGGGGEGKRERKTEKACRPLKRMSKKTPPTLPELVKRHGKKRLLSLASRKRRDMKGRVDWRKGTFSPSR